MVDHVDRRSQELSPQKGGVIPGLKSPTVSTICWTVGINCDCVVGRGSHSKTQCWLNVGPPSVTLTQHWVNISCFQLGGGGGGVLAGASDDHKSHLIWPTSRDCYKNLSFLASTCPSNWIWWGWRAVKYCPAKSNNINWITVYLKLLLFVFDPMLRPHTYC